MKGTICVLQFAHKEADAQQNSIWRDQHIQFCMLCVGKVGICCIELAEGVIERQRGRKGCAQASVPKLHLILEECLPNAHSNQT